MNRFVKQLENIRLEIIELLTNSLKNDNILTIIECDELVSDNAFTLPIALLGGKYGIREFGLFSCMSIDNEITFVGVELGENFGDIQEFKIGDILTSSLVEFISQLNQNDLKYYYKIVCVDTNETLYFMSDDEVTDEFDYIIENTDNEEVIKYVLYNKTNDYIVVEHYKDYLE